MRKPKKVAQKKIAPAVEAIVATEVATAPPVIDVEHTVVDEWRVLKLTSPRTLVAIRTSDQKLARVNVRDSSKYRRGVVVDIVGHIATGLYEGKPPLVKRVEVAS